MWRKYPAFGSNDLQVYLKFAFLVSLIHLACYLTPPHMEQLQVRL